MIASRVNTNWTTYYFLNRAFVGRPLRGRKKSKQPRPWQWEHTSDPSRAFVFDAFAAALKQARRVPSRFTEMFFGGTVGQVWTFDHLSCQTIQKIWPTDDVVSAIGLLSFDEADVEGR